MREKTPLLDKFVCVQIGIKDFYPEVIIILVRNYLFLTMFYTTNSSPLLVTKSVFKLIFVLGNYQTCTFPLSLSAILTFKKLIRQF